MPKIDLKDFEAVRMKTGVHYRNTEITVRAAGEGAEPTYEFYFSSEDGVSNRWMWVEAQERYVYGTEVLLHGQENVDMSWIASGNAPFLKDHRMSEQAGVILGAEIDESARKGKITGLKFSRSQLGQDLKADIDDGVRKNVSVGYVILEVVEAEAPKRDTPGVYHVTRWKPYEVSSVSIPADETVGMRSKEQDFEMIVYRKRSLTNPNGEGTMDPEKDTERGNQNPAPQTIDVKVGEVESDASRIYKIADLNREVFPFGRDLASEAIALRKTSDEFWKEFQPALLDYQRKQATLKIGMTDKDKERFSLLRISQALDPNCPEVGMDDIRFEREISADYCKQRGISSERGGIIVPLEAIPPRASRAAIISSGTGAGVVEEFGSGEVIEYLRPLSVLGRAGARFISGLVGKFDMAKIGVGTTSYWVGEKTEAGDDVTTSAIDLDLLQFLIHTVAASQGITRQMQKQTSSYDVESIVRGDLYQSLADAIDLASLAGTGSNSQPTGVMYTTSVGTEALATANTPLWSDVVNMETTVAEANALRGSLAYIAHPTPVGTMKQTLKASGVSGFIVEGDQCNGYPIMRSTNALKGAVKETIFGNWNELMVGMWGGLELIVNPYKHSEKGITVLTAFQDLDTQVRHPASFVYTTNPA